MSASPRAYHSERRVLGAKALSKGTESRYNSVMMPRDSRQQTGKLGEDLACRALEKRGYQIVARNWRCVGGEIDIIALDGDCYAFVEVKTRRSRRAGPPEDGLTEDKAERLLSLAEVYLGEQGLDRVSWRLDLVAIELDHRGAVQRLNVIPGVGVS
jgi:putative endonuclease